MRFPNKQFPQEKYRLLILLSDTFQMNSNYKNDNFQCGKAGVKEVVMLNHEGRDGLKCVTEMLKQLPTSSLGPGQSPGGVQGSALEAPKNSLNMRL